VCWPLSVLTVKCVDRHVYSERQREINYRERRRETHMWCDTHVMWHTCDVTFPLYSITFYSLQVQAIPEEMSLEMIIGLQITTVNAKVIGLFSSEMCLERCLEASFKILISIPLRQRTLWPIASFAAARLQPPHTNAKCGAGRYRVWGRETWGAPFGKTKGAGVIGCAERKVLGCAER